MSSPAQVLAQVHVHLHMHSKFFLSERWIEAEPTAGHCLLQHLSLMLTPQWAQSCS